MNPQPSATSTSTSSARIEASRVVRPALRPENMGTTAGLESRARVAVAKSDPFAIMGEGPVVEQWWFWTVIGIAAIGAFGSTYLVVHHSRASDSELGASRFSEWGQL